jgi:hypothetical protein
MYVVAGSVGIFFFLRLIELCLLVGMTAYWLSSMQRLMASCHSFSRTSEPGLVWLTFIPLFGFVWQFVAIKNVSDTLVREYNRRGWHLTEKRPAMELGLVAAVAMCLVFLVRMFIPLHPVLGFFGTLTVCFFMWRHTEELIAFRERPEKEIDKTTAFGQIPYINPNDPFAQYANPYQQYPNVPQQPNNPYRQAPSAPQYNPYQQQPVVVPQYNPYQQQPPAPIQNPYQPPQQNPYQQQPPAPVQNPYQPPQPQQQNPYQQPPPPPQNPYQPPQPPPNPYTGLPSDKNYFGGDGSDEKKPDDWSKWAPKK